MTGLWRRRAFVCIVALTVLAGSSGVRAHNVPPDVIVRVLARIEPDHIRFIVRVPLAALRDVQDPSPGNVTVAAHAWLGNAVRLHADDVDRGAPVVRAVWFGPTSTPVFDDWNLALATVTTPPTGPVATAAQVAVLLEWPLSGPVTRVTYDAAFEQLGRTTQTVFRLVGDDGTSRFLTYTGNPGRVDLHPTWHQAARRFVISGVEHILLGVDHVLFLVCLVIPFTRVRALVLLVTAFTVGHSVTLMAGALGWTPSGEWFGPLVETIIAFSILWLAIENVVGTPSVTRRWSLAAVFGLVHGFGFSFVLGDLLQFGGTHVAWPLAGFNVGVELGQLLLLGVLLWLRHLLFAAVGDRVGTILVAVVAGHQAWHWMTERATDLFAHLPIVTPDVVWTWGLRVLVLAWIGVGFWLFWRRRV